MDYEPITKELRKDFDLCTRIDGIAPDEFETVWITKSAVLATLDNIDAIHRSLEQENERLRNASEHGDDWIKLPVDADGVTIHIGDRMENNERVARIVLTDDSWEPSVYLEKLPNVLHEYFCNEISHYHPDTWESIIEDATKLGFTDPDNEHLADKLVARCKALCERTREGEE